MQINPNTQRQYKDLLLTSSLDWSVKLWNFMPQDDSRTAAVSVSTRATTTQSRSDHVSSQLLPLFEFITPTYNYVSDVQWCPNNPALFSTITSCGHLSLWNLCKSVSEPIETVSVSNEKSANFIGSNNLVGVGGSTPAAAGGGSGIALNKSAWSSSGRFILLGDSRGCVHMVTVQEHVTAFSSADENKLEMLLVGNNVATKTLNSN